MIHLVFCENIMGKAVSKEVDFVARSGVDRIYVQVTYLLATEDTVEREFTALEIIPDNYPKYVVSMDEISRSRNGIKHMNIRDFFCVLIRLFSLVIFPAFQTVLLPVTESGPVPGDILRPGGIGGKNWYFFANITKIY